MKDIEQYLRDNAPETPAEGQFLIETNARLNAVEGIKKTVDGERRRGRIALIVALAAGLVLGCLITLLVLFYLSFATVHWIEPFVGTGWAFAIVSAFFLLLLLLTVLLRKPLIEKPLVKFLTETLMN